MPRQTPLLSAHQAAGATMVSFHGWDMPLHYGSQMTEHLAVRQSVGMFDVSHMGIVDVTGPQARSFLRYVLANDVAKIDYPGRALYACMLNAEGGIIDTLIVYCLGQDRYRLVLNASQYEMDWSWLMLTAETFQVSLTPREDLAMLAVQGPASVSVMAHLLVDDLAQQLATLPFFSFVESGDLLLSRTGYTGELGVELMVPSALLPGLWQDLLDANVPPCGLGARDTLRLEAGFNLVGIDTTTETTPFEVSLGWTVSFDDVHRQFLGRAALLAVQQQGVPTQQVGLTMRTEGVLSDQQTVWLANQCQGVITSGSYSPMLKCTIALARFPRAALVHQVAAEVECDGSRATVSIVQPPFTMIRSHACINIQDI